MRKYICVSLIFLNACTGARYSWQAQGPDFPAKKNIEVHYTPDKIKESAAYTGRIISQTPCKKKACAALAAKHGADGILIMPKENIKAYAFKYTDTLTEEERQIIREYAAVHFFRD